MRLEKQWDVLAMLPHVAFTKYQRKFASAIAQPSARFRSTSIQEIMVDEARRAFGHDVVKGRGRWLLRGQDLVVQFKKMSKSGRTSNIPTVAALNFAAQLELPGIPSGTRLTLGYRLNREATEVLEVRLVAQLECDIVWSEEMVSNQPVLALPGRATAKSTVRRLRAKSDSLPSKKKKSKE